MKVKFYKGPFHGKTQDVNPHDLRSGILLMAVYDDRAVDYQYDNGLGLQIYQPAGIRHCKYKIKLMSGEVMGQKFAGPAVHPDGSIFLEYVKEK